jgi:RNA polymerase sigma-70 factor (family 1)
MEKAMHQYQDVSDFELEPMLAMSDQRAFELIYQQYAKQLFSFVRKNISVKEDCEEIIQDIFVSLWERRNELGHVTALGPYLFQMVRYKVIRYFHHKGVIKKYEQHYRLFEALYDTIKEEERPSGLIEEKLLTGLAKLPERCQMAFRLRMQENLSNEDIARRMKIKKSTVENYMVTAVKHLRSVYPDVHHLINTG